jgi:hypothetical protein
MSSKYLIGAWKEAGISAMVIDEDNMEITFSNGVVLPILEFLNSTKTHTTVEPVEGGFIAFGDDDHGFGYYPIKLISEEEWHAQQEKNPELSADNDERRY